MELEEIKYQYERIVYILENNIKLLNNTYNYLNNVKRFMNSTIIINDKAYSSLELNNIIDNIINNIK